MLKRQILTLGLLFCLVTATVFSQQKIQIDVRAPERLDKPESGVIPNATVQEDINTDQIRRLLGAVTVPGATGQIDAADRFLRENESLLLRSRAITSAQVTTLAATNEFRRVREIESLSGKYLVYERVYQGLPVLDDQLIVHVDKTNKITALNSDLSALTEITAVVVPQDSAAAKAEQSAIEDVGARSEPLDLRATKAVLMTRVGSKVKPLGTWKITFKTRSPAAAWRVIVDGSGNQVLSRSNVAQYVDGSGLIFNPNPIQSGGDNTLLDEMGGSEDADHPKLADARAQVTLHDLDDSTGFLQGKYASTSLTASRASEPTRIYSYPRNDSRFEEVMAYYWVTENQRYIQSLGFTNINNRRVDMDVHFSDEDNSFYDPESKTLQFGNGGIDDAEDAEVILHELGHAIQDNQVQGFGGINRHTEARAMGEGFGDYWSASFFAGSGPKHDLWNVFWDKWDGQPFNAAKGDDPPFLRRLDSKKHYPDDWAGEEHTDGEIWSACLWQIRERLGRRRADTVILESHFRLNGVTRTFEEGAKAILLVHEALEKNLPSFSADSAAIRKIFTDRGILK